MADNSTAKADEVIQQSRDDLIAKAEALRVEMHGRFADLGFYIILGNGKGQWASRGTFSRELLKDVLTKIQAQLDEKVLGPLN